MVVKNKCKGFNKNGDPCKQSAVLSGYCVTHYQMEYGIKDDREPSEKYSSKRYGIY